MNSSPVTKPLIFIEAKDNKGENHNYCIKTWAEKTGKSIHLIRTHYQRKRKGLDITNRQVAGLDDIDYRRRAEQKAERKKQILSHQEVLVNTILSRRLVA